MGVGHLAEDKVPLVEDQLEAGSGGIVDLAGDFVLETFGLVGFVLEISMYVA